MVSERRSRGRGGVVRVFGRVGLREGLSECSLLVKSGIIQLHQKGKKEENSISAINLLGLLHGGAHTRTQTQTGMHDGKAS